MSCRGRLGALMGAVVLCAPLVVLAQAEPGPEPMTEPPIEPTVDPVPEPADPALDPMLEPVEEPVLEPTVEPAPVYVETREVRTYGPASGFGVQVALGGGVTNFTEDAARSLTDPGGSWNLRVTLGTRSIVGFEAAYVGVAQDTEAVGLDPDAYLVGNGAEAAIRLNAPLSYRDWLFEPFALAGVGWTRYDVVNESFNNSIIQDNDNVLFVPVGGGLASSFRGFMFDARFTYRAAFDDDLLGPTEMHNWIVSANLGREF